MFPGKAEAWTHRCRAPAQRSCTSGVGEMTADEIRELIRNIGKKPNLAEVIYYSACFLVGFIAAWLIFKLIRWCRR